MRIPALILLVAFSLPLGASAEEVLFLGAPYQRANGHSAQVRTVLWSFVHGESWARGEVRHWETQSSYKLHFSVACVDGEFRFAADAAALDAAKASLRVYPEWTLVTFPDGARASLPKFKGYEDAERIARDRYQTYVRSGEPKGQVAAIAEIHRILALHADMLPMLASALLARACAGAGQE